jgi:hypothetical protein
MEATILILIVGSFACWCAWQCFKPRENSELEKCKDKDKDKDARRDDMHRRFKDVEPPTDWARRSR